MCGCALKSEDIRLRFVAVLLSILLCLRIFQIESIAKDSKTDASDVIKSGFYSFKDSIDVSGFDLTPAVLSSLFSSIIKDDPYLFFVNNNLAYSYTSGGYVLSLKPTYSMVGQDVFVAWDLCREMVRRIASLANKYETDAGKALFVHDYICSNFSYDPSLQSNDIYSFFLTGRGTCQSYTYAYMAVLRQCGIEAHYVASDAIAHIWNYVNIDGEWYHADLTWDDQGESISRRHFLCSDKRAKERGHRDWYSSENRVCDSETYYDFVFDNLLHKEYSLGDVDHNGSIDVCDIAQFRLHLANVENFVFCLMCADLNCDGLVNESDMVYLRKKLLGDG